MALELWSWRKAAMALVWPRVYGLGLALEDLKIQALNMALILLFWPWLHHWFDLSGLGPYNSKPLLPIVRPAKFWTFDYSATSRNNKRLRGGTPTHTWNTINLAWSFTDFFEFRSGRIAERWINVINGSNVAFSLVMWHVGAIKLRLQVENLQKLQNLGPKANIPTKEIMNWWTVKMDERSQKNAWRKLGSPNRILASFLIRGAPSSRSLLSADGDQMKTSTDP